MEVSNMENNLLSVDDLAEKLNIPKSRVYSFTRQGEIPMIKIGKYCRFQLDEVMNWLKKINEAE
jgi:excisionase family DNA binding protein